jgi:hypothetical protein
MLTTADAALGVVGVAGLWRGLGCCQGCECCGEE